MSNVGRNCPGSVYFIEADGFGRIKIGSARSPEKRLKELQTGSPAQLRIMATITADDPRRLEARLHMAFQDARVVGEWFHATRTLRRIIDAAASTETEVDYAREIGGRPCVRLRPLVEADADTIARGCCDLLEVVGVDIDRPARDELRLPEAPARHWGRRPV